MDPAQLSSRRLTITDVRVIETSKTYDIQFDLDWREAFRDGEHWNAAWVFLKIKPGKTEAVESAEDALQQLTHGNTPGTQEVVEMKAKIKAQIEHALATMPPGSRPPFAPGPPGFPPGLPPPPAVAEAIKDRIAEKLAEGVPPQQTDEDTPAGHDPALAPSPKQREETYSERAGIKPLHAFRLRHTHIEQGGQQVEVDDDFAFLTPSEDGKTHTVTSFTRWEHMMVSNNPDDHRPTKGAIAMPSEDGMGVFIYRDEDARGPLRLSGVRLRTTVPCDGQALKAWVGALEMVHIPAGEFHIGDPKGPEGPPGCFHRAGASGSDQSYVVSSEDELEVGDDDGKLTWNNQGQMGEPANVPAPFPKGHAAFYMLKHQVSQGEYCDFINHLKGNQITIRYPYGGQGDYRYTVFKTWNAARVCTRPERAANWTSWSDARAYIWWAGLRPATELEYEKAARGPAQPVADEYAWGSATLVQSLVILGDEAGRPIVQGNCNIGNPLQPFHGGDGSQGPVPEDAFRASRYQCNAEAVHLTVESEETFTWREETGGSYYEVMGLSGNLWEYVVSVGIAEGRRFLGEHGTGNLDASGGPDQENSWPGHDNRGLGYRGGSWYTKVSSGRIADRCFGSGLIGFYDRGHDTGIRAARTAPKK